MPPFSSYPDRHSIQSENTTFVFTSMHTIRTPQLHRATPPQLQFLRRLFSISATSATRCYTSSTTHQHTDSLLTTLSEAIANNSTPLETSLRTLLPSLKPSHFIHLITTNPHNLTPHTLYSFFQWLSTRPPFRHTLQSYFTMITHLSAHQMIPQAQSLLHFIVSQKGKHSASSVFQAFVQTQGTQHESRHDFVLNCLINCYVDHGFVSDAVQLIRHAKDQNFRVSFECYDRVFECMLKLNNNVGAWGFYLEVLGCGYPPNTYVFNKLMHRFVKEGMVNDAKKVFDEMPKWGVRPSLVSFNTLLNGYCKLGKLSEGFRLKKVIAENGLVPDVFTYSVLINGLCKEGKLGDAHQLFDEMCKRGLNPNDVIFTTLINGLCRNAKADLAMQMYGKMLVRGVKADLITFNTLINGLCKSGRIIQARYLIDEMTRVGLKADKITYTSLLDGCCKEGNLDLALEVKEKMVNEGVDLDNVTFTALISGLYREGLVINAEKTLREMRKSGLKPDAATYTMVIDGFCKKGDVKTGFHLLKEMRRDGVIPGVITYNVLMSGLCKLGQLKNANKLLRSMLDLGVVPDDITYNILLDGHCRYGDPELIEKLSSEKGLVSDYASYISLVEGSIKH